MQGVSKRNVVPWIVLLALGCSTGESACTGCVEPIAGGFPTDAESRTNNAMTAKLSPAGLDFFESRVNDIISSVAGDQLQNIQVPCTYQPQTFENPLYTCVFGLCGPGDEFFTVDIYACDHNRDNACTGADNAAPQIDEQRPTSPPLKACQASSSVTSLRITPSQASAMEPLEVKIALALRVNTGTIPISATLPYDICTLNCAVELDSNESGNVDIPVEVDITLTVDPASKDVLAVRVGDIALDDVFDTDDLEVRSNSSGLCSQICRLGSIDFVKDTIFDLVKGTVEEEIYDIIDTFRCRACEARTNNCPADSRCVAAQGVCYSCAPGAECVPQYDPDRNVRVCPPASLGLEGRLSVGEFLAAFGAPGNSLLDVYAVAGGRTDGVPDVKAQPIGTSPTQPRGIVFGIMGGTRPVIREQSGTFTAPGQSKCVPLRPWTGREPAEPVDFDAVAVEASGALIGLRDYHFGLSLSDNFLDKSLHDVYAAGLLCLNVDSSVSTFLSSSLFRTFLPSLGVLTQGQDVPMLVALRPKQAPEITLGLGTTKIGPNGERIPDDPLMTIDLRQVQIDFYALIEERQARLFSLTADIRLPLSLEFNPSLNTVRPVLADLETVVSNIVAANSEMLHEDPRIVADLISAIIGLVQPVLASVLAPMELPTFNGFKLEVRHASGTVPMANAASGYQHMALLADLKLVPQTLPYVSAADTAAQLVEGFVPTRAALLGAAGARPVAVVQASGSGMIHRDFRGYEFSYRVDGSLWSPWIVNERLEIRSPVLLFEGRHDIEVRAREIDGAESEDLSPARVVFVVDYDAPAVRLELDAQLPIIRTLASDAVSRSDELVFRYRVGDGAWGADGAAREFFLSELGPNPGLEVEVVDGAGHVGRARYGAVEPGGSAADQGPPGVGCTQGGAGLLAALGLLRLARRRRG